MTTVEHSVPVEEQELWQHLSFTRNLTVGAVGWAQAAKLRQSLVEISPEDGAVIVAVLERQIQNRRSYPLDAVDLRQIRNRTVVRTERGEIEVEVPERDEEAESEPIVGTTDLRTSLNVQAKIARLGMVLGYTIWIPAGDRNRVLEITPRDYRDHFMTTLPLNYDLTTLKTIGNIDVIWLQGRSIVRAFEIEHTTAIYSGLLRMADLLAMQPNMKIDLHIVAPDERREQVRREIVRPVFSVLEGGAMSSRCSYLSYSAIDAILAQPNLEHMRASIVEDFEEFFDA
jgi:hypothetical protein